MRIFLTCCLVVLGLLGSPAFAQSPDITAQNTAGAANRTAQPTPAPAVARSAPTAARSPEYTLGAGDVIRVNVYPNPDLSLETRISEQGQISYPLVGQVTLSGIGVPAAATVPRMWAYRRVPAPGPNLPSFPPAPAKTSPAPLT